MSKQLKSTILKWDFLSPKENLSRYETILVKYSKWCWIERMWRFIQYYVTSSDFEYLTHQCHHFPFTLPLHCALVSFYTVRHVRYTDNISFLLPQNKEVFPPWWKMPAKTTNYVLQFGWSLCFWTQWQSVFKLTYVKGSSLSETRYKTWIAKKKMSIINIGKPIDNVNKYGECYGMILFHFSAIFIRI